MKLVCIAPPDDVPRLAALFGEGDNAGDEAFFFAEIEELPPGGPREERERVFLVAHKDVRAATRIVRALRQDARTGLQPLYTMHSFGKPLDLLTDGNAASPAEAADQARPVLARLAELADSVFSEDAGDSLRILALLYSRPDRQLAPHRVWLDEHAYAYSLLEALLGSAHLVAARLTTLSEQGHLQRRGLIDRTSHCPVCSSLQINLVDHCPQCRSTDIEECAQVQCLRCGHTAPESAFVPPGAGGLVCPACNAALAQIKTDYDLAAASFRCRACGLDFEQPEPLAHCLRCGHYSPVKRLLVRRIYSYELTDAGIAALKSGALSDPVESFGEGNLVTPQFFSSMVNWLLDFCGRHATEAFTLIGIRMDCTDQPGADSSPEVMNLMDTFVHRISEHIRNIDMLSRFRRDMVWLLLPRTGKPHFQVVLDRIEKLQQGHASLGEEKMCFRTVLFHAPDDIVPGESGPLLLERLEAAFPADEERSE